jgi:23S rRNA pseudouridine955/2504/2580 synthase
LKELIIDKNESEQRLDRFLKKYLSRAPQSFIYKMIRKKNIKLNGKRANPETIIEQGDTIQLYLADETIEKFKGKDQVVKSSLIPKIIYEDDNIILINKPVGILSHSANKDYGNNIVDSMIHYLHVKGEYNPRIERTFTPAICNRLDRNTSGIIIGAKNYEALKMLNASIKKGSINRYYKTIVKGQLKKDGIIEGYLLKDEELNKVKVLREKKDDSKKIRTRIQSLAISREYSLLEIELITGRTHQIRAHLASIGYPVIGDIKYGDRNVNQYFKVKYGLESQFLHGYKVIFNDLDEPLDYLNGQEFIGKLNDKFGRIEEELFK